MAKQKSFSRGELALVAGALAAIAVFFFLWRAPGQSGTAHVTVEGAEVLVLPLGQTPDSLIDLGAYGIPARLEVKEGRVRFVQVTCPDHICEKTGWVWKDGQSAVCMPNRASVVIVG